MKDFLKKFENNFRVTPGCWLWQRGVDKDGYGQFYAEGKNIRAHRYSYKSYFGPIPEGMCVCHRCDTPRCVNPDHLFLGTSQENTADRHAKGRTTVLNGERHGASRLKSEQVLEIRAMRGSHREIANKFGISATTVYRIKKLINWGHL